MRIQISKDLDEEKVKRDLKSIEIVEEGDYLLIPKYGRLQVYDHRGPLFIEIYEIDYIESFGQKVLVNSKDKEYESSLKLYQFLDLSDEFIRINKSQIVNIHRIEDIRPSMNMKYRILIKGLEFDVNRSYYYAFKDALGI